MSNLYFDIETLSTSSEAVVLSAAILWFDLENDQNIEYEELLNRALFVKFEIKEQALKGRKISRSTIEWWKNQSEEARKMSFIPSSYDVSGLEGLELLTQYANTHLDKNGFAWQRGNFDSMIIESMYRAYDLEPFIRYNKWMETRTFIRLTKDTCNSNAYCKIPNFDKKLVIKHDPIHDIAYDTLMILKGE